MRANLCGRGLTVGASLAVNGCCLTVVKLAARGKSKLAQFDLLKETWQRTNLQFAKPGSLVNLERPLRTDGNLGGHFVTGHIDGIGKITRWERMGQDHVLDIAAPPEVMRYVVFKGSMAVDGISLTVAGVGKKGFRIWIIPHTYEVTALRERKQFTIKSRLSHQDLLSGQLSMIGFSGFLQEQDSLCCYISAKISFRGNNKEHI